MDDEPLTFEAIRAAMEEMREAHRTYVPPTFEETLSLQPWAAQVAWYRLQREALVRTVWEWIISVNDGSGLDADDLAYALEHSGAPCPQELSMDPGEPETCDCDRPYSCPACDPDRSRS